MHSALKTVCVIGCVSLLAACDSKPETSLSDQGADSQGFSVPTGTTREHNRAFKKELPLADQRDFEQARRGLIASPENLVVEGHLGRKAWDMTAYEFVKGEAPDSVNPSLWRQAQLNNIHGLFEVTRGIYQLRGFDLANMTLIEGDSGWIVVDPLTASQTAAAAMAFAKQHLGDKPITAVIFTHSHIDHFGGVLGALQEANTAIEDVQVIAPVGFLDEAVSENILAGPTMMRRSDYMYGLALPKSERGHVDTGLGKAPADGSVAILEATHTVRQTGETLTLDGVEFIFQDVSGSEAPAELTFYLPQHKAFCGAELVSRSMHNLYTLRGAKVRDALAWSGFIDEAKQLFADAEIYFASHHWPIWGQEEIQAFLEGQRDIYKYIHDQTLRLALHGYTPSEIVEQIELPESLARQFSNRGYYGTVRHNARAVYQRYFGWYDGNPANLNPLTPEQEATRYIKAMGGPGAVLAQASSAFEDGDYRWVATLLNHLVFAEPKNAEAAQLLAKTYDQLGYQAESGPWRDVYLSAANELRHGKITLEKPMTMARGMIKHSSRSHFFDAMAAHLNGPDAEGVELVINFTFTDLNENHVLTVKNSVLHHRMARADPNANATVKITHELFLDLVLESGSLTDLLLSDQLALEGSKLDLIKFFSLQDKIEGDFEIVRP